MQSCLIEHSIKPLEGGYFPCKAKQIPGIYIQFIFSFILNRMKKYLLLHEFLGKNYFSSWRWTKENEKHIAHSILNSDSDQTLEHIFEYWVSD